MSSYVLGFQDIDKTKLMVVGGKGANLGELSKIEGIRVPDGFCISTEAFKRNIGESSSMNELLDQLSLLKVEDRDKIGELSGEIRRVIEGIAIPQDIHEEITRLLSRLDEKNAYAVRSSATAEDLPTASFAGQQDTYLKVIDKKISTKKLAMYDLKDSGTKEQEIEPERQNRQALTDEQILQLERIGRKIEEHFGCPQDIEWCLVDDTFSIVQSRPITTLYPIPDANDQENHVYVSVGHQQMMTDAMKPLGISFCHLTPAHPLFQPRCN